MPRYMVKLADDAYVEWSTVVDAPVSYVMTRAEASAEPGEKERVERCDRHGHSSLWMDPTTIELLVAGNRAGEDETELTVQEIIEQYSRKKGD